MRALRLIALSALSALPLAACGEAKQPPAATCGSCHGSAESAAPPRALGGFTALDYRGVGAHQAHLGGAVLGRPVACEECHVVPETTDAPGHIDTAWPAELKWGPISKTGDLSPIWSPETLTCSNTWCHGSAAIGATIAEPEWTVVDGGASKCGACHGLPPPSPHPASDNCGDCHAAVTGAQGDASKHIDGKVDLIIEAPSTCAGSCHGTDANTAPPTDLAGQSDTSSVTVGAHQTHLSGGVFSAPVACIECHLEPSTQDEAGHIDTPPPAELVWGPVATLGGSSPTFSRAAATCANTYCHGSATVTWTVVDGTEAACGSCHGLPPAAPHPASAACEMCHGMTAGPNQTIANSASHVNGQVEVMVVAATCAGSCHGSDDNTAPPTDLAGQSDTSSVTVGAHQTHLDGGVFSAPVACTECHLEPSSLNEAGHVDTPRPAELVWGTVAMTGGASPAFTRATATCANTYCHGSTTVTWTVVDGTEAACGSCHGLPPPAPHPTSDACEMCHAMTAGPNQTIVNSALHVNGQLEVEVMAATCAGTCHGSDDNTAPPTDLAGQSDTSSVTVGAHQTHLTGGVFSAPVACTECHLEPSTLNEAGHIDTPPPAELTFGPVATRGGAVPAYSRPNETCGNTYCHGSAMVSWTVVDGTEAACGSCHGLPPAAPHPASAACEMCHGMTAGPNQTIANSALHVNGQLEF